MIFINVKTIRKLVNLGLDLIYLTPFKKSFLWLLSRLPFNYLYAYLWVNSPEYYLKSFQDDFSKKIKKAKLTYKNKHILEIGSGSSFGWGYIFILLGAKTYTASDKTRSANMSQRAINAELRLIKLIEKRYKKKILDRYVSFQGNLVKPLTKKLNFQTLDITTDQLNIKTKYDLIISNAVFEHLPKDKVNQSIKNMRTLLKPGGYMLHHIDLRDHFNLNQPFSFYQFSDKQWLELTNKGPFYTNRLRSKDYLSLFIKNGFSIIYKKQKKSKIDIRRIHPSFKKYSDKELANIDTTIALKKIR